MNILYLHGYNSSHINDRTEWLQSFGNLIHPAMQYRNFPENFQYIESLFQGQKLDVIVGSSLGGYFAFHLGNYYQVPTILLNPALLMTHIIKLHNRQWAGQAKHYIAIGKNDEIIPPWTTQNALTEWQSRYQMFTYDMGHETSFEVFLDVCRKSGLFTAKNH